MRVYAILTLLCALLYLPGLTSIPPTDRDEARFMQATKQMIETGDYINIHFQDEPRNKKPAGIHWLQTAAVKIAGRDLSTFGLTACPRCLPHGLLFWPVTPSAGGCSTRAPASSRQWCWPRAS